VSGLGQTIADGEAGDAGADNADFHCLILAGERDNAKGGGITNFSPKGAKYVSPGQSGAASWEGANP
jgi:hypothetical protein